MFEEMEDINARPKPFEFYTASELWTDEHTSAQMLSCHLNEELDLSSRKAKFIDRSVEWIASHFDVGAYLSPKSITSELMTSPAELTASAVRTWLPKTSPTEPFSSISTMLPIKQNVIIFIPASFFITNSP